MLFSPEFLVFDPLNGSYADLLFVQPFARILHHTDTSLMFSIAENLADQLSCLAENIVTCVISERYMQGFF